ncbi:MAG TPA: branched-chain amino acid ABC transporter substrate-binding protein [Cyanobacteria bacterium UBA11149]|nr:branched-chain amino acid ABC transporter substrate-binding protein [Cyanobacteria bacterium UBA11366]HBK66370.1 branched-chain amino acid ABC transporter substrate-binding protein [Cyanobacteria bacterium UBA11166]HBR74136.1 branched-chain amino acid ABC transporter substrate-binding protein [Cyanobacteria bacterium UBA11159]HBS71337.1 branched-chain amino acid ABC transporter substrate-binding protein [Cyanobacteria bacterium UBA11153]HBW87618.1 branched-chain amino acid ABC transporter su
MFKKRLFSQILPFLFSFLLVVACSQTNQPSNTTSGTPGNTSSSGKTIPIGIAVAQTSNTALIGQEQVIGAKIAEKYFNDKGGVNGTPIRLIFQDAGGDEQSAINAFNTLINQDKVVGIVGPSASQQAFAADPIAERASIPVIAASNTAKNIPQIGKYISRVSAPISVVAPNALKEAIKLNPNIKKVAVFYAQNDAFSKSETETFQQAVKDQKLELVTVQKFQTTDTDFQTQATNAINLKPDLIIISGWTADGGNLVKQLRELGYKALIIGGNGLNTSNIFPICQKLCDGIIIAQAYSPELNNEINKTFREAYKAEKKQDPPQFSAQTFAAVQVFVEALTAVDSKTKVNGLPLAELRTKLNEQVLAGSYETPLGAISFDPEGEVKQGEFFVAQIKMDADGKNGKFTFLK